MAKMSPLDILNKFGKAAHQKAQYKSNTESDEEGEAVEATEQAPEKTDAGGKRNLSKKSPKSFDKENDAAKQKNPGIQYHPEKKKGFK